jgi:hypothetical protein
MQKYQCIYVLTDNNFTYVTRITVIASSSRKRASSDNVISVDSSKFILKYWTSYFTPETRSKHFGFS